MNLEKKTLFAQIAPIGMDQIRDIMETSVKTMGYYKSALDAAKMLTEKKDYLLGSSKKNKPVGIVTERDIIQKISSGDEKPSEFPLSDIITTEF